MTSIETNQRHSKSIAATSACLQKEFNDCSEVRHKTEGCRCVYRIMKSYCTILLAVPAAAFIANGPKALFPKRDLLPLSPTFSYLASLGVSDGGGSNSGSADIVSPYFQKGAPSGMTVNGDVTKESGSTKDAYTVRWIHPTSSIRSVIFVCGAHVLFSWS
jgi:hypothetical protein